MRVSAVAFVGVAALGAVACAGILGIQDRSLDTADGGGDDGGGCGADPCTMMTGLNHPFEMTADETNVYWTEFGNDLYSENGSVKSCPASGCGAGPLVYAVVQQTPRGIAVDAQNVYWGTSVASGKGGAIWSCAISGCNGQPTKVVDANAPYGVALDATYVYWVDNYDNTVHRAPKAGGADQLLWDAGGSVGLSNGQECAVDGKNAYVTDNNISLFRVPIGGGDLVQMFSQSAGWYGAAPVVTDPSGVYLGMAGQILRFAPTDTSATGTPIVSTVAGPSGLAVDRATATLYWSDFGTTGVDGTLGKVPLDGGAPTTLRQSLQFAENVAVNGTYVFWLSNGTPNPDGGGAFVGTGVLYRMKK